MTCMVSNFERQIRVMGHVKWNDAIRGFGFVELDQSGGDVLLHKSVLLDFGQSSVTAGSRIELSAALSGRGLQACEIFEIQNCEVEGNESKPSLDDTDIAGALVPARVKWFDKRKGYGFVNLFDSDEDCYIHVDVLCRGGLQSVETGEAIGVRVTRGSQSINVVQAAPWADIFTKSNAACVDFRMAS